MYVFVFAASCASFHLDFFLMGCSYILKEKFCSDVLKSVGHANASMCSGHTEKQFK